MTPPYISSQYINNYKEGLETARFYAKTQKIYIIYKYFVIDDVSNLPMQMSRVNAWNPDVVIGPNYSNSFLLLKNYFKDDIFVKLLN